MGGGDGVAEALAYLRRATASRPRSEARLREALDRRDHPPEVIDAALDRARRDGWVDDEAYAAALVDEWRRKGHADRRIRADLDRRGIPAQVAGRVLADRADADPDAAAYALASQRAQMLRRLPPETAFRRLLGYLARRGYPEASARRAARLAVFNDREPERTAER